MEPTAMNPIPNLRNINRNLFDVPTTANALKEHDSDVNAVVLEAAGHLFNTRRDNDQTALGEAYKLPRRDVAELVKGAGSSVYARTHVMVTARLVELEAALLAAESKTTTE
jgi:hypothetical protein